MSGYSTDVTTVKDLVEQRGLRQDQVAVLVGYSTGAVNRVLTGKRAASPQFIVRLAQALGVSARRVKVLCDRARADALAAAAADSSDSTAA